MNIFKPSTFALIAATLFITSCKKDKTLVPPANEPVPQKANVTFQFNNQVGGMDIEMGKMQYMNAAGNAYQIDLLKYYVTNVTLVKSDNTEIKVGNFDLINAADLSTCVVNAPNIPNGTYTKIKFNVGIPYDRNHTGAQDGDLDPLLGMIWDWNTGYVFFKHEGKFKNTSNVTQSLIFHFATDRAYSSVEIPLSTNLEVAGVAKKVSLIFNLNKLYASPTTVDFNTDSNRQSSSSADFPWIDNLKLAFNSAFTVDKIE